MYTQADKELDAARAAVQDALQCLGKILVEKCEGHADYKPEFIAALQESIPLLFQVERKIAP